MMERMKELGEVMKIDRKGNKEVRYHIYKEAIFMIHGKLGFQNYFPLPSWLETEIREMNSSNDGNCIEFCDDDMHP